MANRQLSDKGCSSNTSAIEATQLSKRLKDSVKSKAADMMKRISAKFESNWIQNRLPAGIDQVFTIVQQSDPFPALRQYLKEHDISQIKNEKLENPLHVLFRPDSACRTISKIAETVSLLLNADCSPSDENLWGRTTLEYIQHYSNLDKDNKDQLISQLSRDKVRIVDTVYLINKLNNPASVN